MRCKFLRIALFLTGTACCLVFSRPVHAQRAEQGPKQAARAATAMASSSHPRVTEAILEVLRRGGNAVDALLTAVPLQHVIEPQMSTLAGGMGGLIYWAETGELVYLDAELDHTFQAPVAASMALPPGIRETSGIRIGVPGMVRGMQAAAERFGSFSWDRYFDPAIRAAEDGFVMYSFLYGEMASAVDRLGVHPATREKWMPDGFIPAVGDVVKQPKLARTLRRLAEKGPDYFYEGEWARHFIDEVNRTGGRITLEELADYRMRWAPPLEFTYRGRRLRGAPPASTAGVLNGMIFNILENFDLEAAGFYTESVESLSLIRMAYDLAGVHTIRFVGDPAVIRNPVDQLLSKDYGRLLAGLIRESRSTRDPARLRGIHVPAGEMDGQAPAFGRSRAFTDSNHLVIVDGYGNWVSMTHTVYGSTFGTGLTVDGVGVNSGNTFPGLGVGEGRRVITPFPALMALDETGRPWLAIGSPGLSSRAVALTLINLIGYGMDPQAAVDAPRFMEYGPADPFYVESRISGEVLDKLASRGVRVHTVAPYNWHMGSIHLVVRDQETGDLIGVADPRRAGFAAGF